MKKILAMAAAAALAAGVSASAANPFSDVSTSDWAYQAVADLSDQGIVDGYPDGTFRGTTNITRYEMAQIVARMMAKQDQYSAEQRAMIDQLAAEYADELDSLGVRVSNLEKKVGNISWSGDARMRYISGDNSGDETWDGRVRINMRGQVNEKTTINARFSSDNVNWKNSDDGDVGMEVLNVKHDFGDWSITLGRYGLSFGNQYGWLYGSSWGFDGAKVEAEFGPVALEVGYGQFNRGEVDVLRSQDTFYAKADADFKTFDIYAAYYSNQESNPLVNYDIWGVGALVPFSDFRVFGEYWENTVASSDNDAWNVGVGYGKRDIKKVGSFAVDLAYNDVGSNLYLGGTGAQADIWDAVYDNGSSVSFWNLTAEVTIMQNVYVHGEYAFGTDADNGDDPDDTWTLSLNYVF